MLTVKESITGAFSLFFSFSLSLFLSLSYGLRHCLPGREFAVVVQRWLRLSKDKGQTWVDNSVAADNFEADAGQQFSASAIDVFRAFQEIVEMWDWIAWPGMSRLSL